MGNAVFGNDLALGESVLLFVPDGSSCPARIWSLGAASVTILAPAIDVDSLPMLEDELVMQWFRPRGRFEVAVALVVAFQADGRRYWELEPVDDPVVRQERQYVRGQGGQVATVVRDSGDALCGELVDLAECSVRVRFRSGHLRPQERLTISFDVDGKPIAAAATVFRASVGETSGAEAVLLLEVTPHQADVMRRHIFAEQRKERRIANR